LREPFGRPFGLPRPHRFEPIKAADVTAAFMIAKSAEAAAIAERDKIEKAAKRKYRWAAADRADKQAHKQLSDIEDRIADTPADGLNGILVKLAVWRFWNDLDDGSEHFAALRVRDACQDDGRRRSRGRSGKVVRCAPLD
jgi:hypothetical protein